jgi:hypothetical protein
MQLLDGSVCTEHLRPGSSMPRQAQASPDVHGSANGAEHGMCRAALGAPSLRNVPDRCCRRRWWSGRPSGSQGTPSFPGLNKGRELTDYPLWCGQK